MVMSRREPSSHPRGAAASRARPRLTWHWVAVVAACATLASAGLRILAAVTAGPLWRDEAHSASTAAAPTFASFFDRLYLDSFPLLWQLVLRGWIAVWGNDDTAIRALGLGISLLVLPALWWTCRILGVVPLASLLLAGVAPSFVVWAGIANRAYGLGVALLALLIGAMWRLVEAPTARRAAIAAVAALLAVQTLYYNSVMLAALAGAAALVGLRRGSPAIAGWAAAVGAVSALSLLVYVGIFARAAALGKLVYANIGIGDVAGGLRDAVGASGTGLFAAVAVLVAGACGWGWYAALRRPAVDRREAAVVSEDGRDVVLFAVATATLALLGQAIFLLRLSFFVQPWYYVSVVLVVAVAVDVVVQRAIAPGRIRDVVAGAIALLLVVATVVAVPIVARRQTNIDLVARYLETHARPGDLIVVYPWHFGVSFDRYYRGQVPFMTIPAVEGHDYHRFDQLAELMRDPERIKPGFKRIYDTIAAGHGVWLVGRPLGPDVPPSFPVLAAARDEDPTSWRDGFYTTVAGLQLAYVLQKQSPRVQAVPPVTGGRVNDYENASIALYSLKPR
jgi:hypothetical protein